jgi:hypothetical protein
MQVAIDRSMSAHSSQKPKWKPGTIWLNKAYRSNEQHKHEKYEPCASRFLQPRSLMFPVFVIDFHDAVLLQPRTLTKMSRGNAERLWGNSLPKWVLLDPAMNVS